MSNLVKEEAIGREVESNIRHYHSVSWEDKLQQRVERVGYDVVNHWPTPLKGYKYRFSVIDDDDFNSCACPTGYIFIYRGLLENVESDDELEAVLAHEVAHVEQRHALKRVIKAEGDAKAAAVIGVLVAGAAGAAASSGQANGQATVNIMAAAGGLTFELVQLAQQIAVTGYDREQEKEADLFASIYFRRRGKDPSVMVNVLKKIRSGDHSTTFADQLSSLSVHPGVKDRIFLTKNVTFKVLDQVVFDGFNKDDELLFSASFHSECFFEERSGIAKTKIFCEITSTAALAKPDKVTGLQLRKGQNYYEFNTDDEPFVFPLDSMGVSFVGKYRNFDLSSEDFDPLFRGLSSAKLVRRSPIPDSTKKVSAR